MKKIISIFLIVILILTSDMAAASAAMYNQGKHSANKNSSWDYDWGNNWNTGWNTNENNNENNNGSNKNNNRGNDWDNWGYDWSKWGYNWGYNWWGGTTCSYNISKSPTIKYGSYKIPTSPFTDGMGASTKYDKKKKIFTVSRGNIAIDIYLKDKKVYVNGAPDPYSGIFTAKDSMKSKALITYIANILGVQIIFKEDEVTVVTPGLDVPAELNVTAVGGSVIKNTLNSTNLSLKASARIKAGQAAGGRAELYVGSKLVATDYSISSTDKTVEFTTSDNSPTNSELKAAVPTGGIVTVRLYNIYNNVAASTANPNLAVDYNPPTIAFGSSNNAANYNAANGKLYISVASAGVIGDKVDVTKLTFYNSSNNKYTLTSNAGSASSGVVTGTTSLEVTVSPIDQYFIASLGNISSLYLLIAGSVLYDTAGNRSQENITQMLPVNQSSATPVPSVLSAPANVTVIPSGGTVVANTLNKTNLSMTVTAQITAGQAAGGRAELYIDNRITAVDPYIEAGDSFVTFTVPDGAASGDRLQAAVPAGGIVTVRLYKSDQSYYVTSAVANPTLKVDYQAPAISGISSAGYSVDAGQLYIVASGAEQPGDKVDISKITLYDATGKTVYLGNASGAAVTAMVGSGQILLINLGSLYKDTLKNFNSTAYLKISAGPLLRDTAGNTSAGLAADQVVPLTIIKIQ